jgi:hypothetical protein
VERLRYDEDTAFTLADDAATLARIIRTVPADTLRAKKFGEWTALEVIGHVADMGDVFADRVRRIATEERPHLAAVDQDKVAAERRNNEREPMEFSKRVLASHTQIVQLLVTTGNRSRIGVHDEMGEVDAAHIAGYHARHAHEHVSDLAAAFPPTR